MFSSILTDYGPIPFGILSALVSGVMAVLLTLLVIPRKKDKVETVLDRARLWAGWAVGFATLATFYKILLPPPKGGAEGIATWLATSVGFGLFAFAAGVAYQVLHKAFVKLRGGGPELIGSTIRKTADTTTDFVHRLHSAASSRKACAACKALLQDDMQFCPACGVAFKEQESACQGCGKKLTANQSFCSHCGKKVAPG